MLSVQLIKERKRELKRKREIKRKGELK